MHHLLSTVGSFGNNVKISKWARHNKHANKITSGNKAVTVVTIEDHVKQWLKGLKELTFEQHFGGRSNHPCVKVWKKNVLC